MNRTSTWVIGFVLLAALVVLFTVVRSPAPIEPAADLAEPLAAPADCNAAQSPCVVRGQSLAVEVAFGPSVRPMQPFASRLRPVRGEISDAATVELQFKMRGMDMGQNRYRLSLDDEGTWTGQITLPVCRSGRSDWIADLDIRDRGRRWSAEIPFQAE